jgi:predicted GTPase
MVSRILIMGAAGRDFHVFNCCYRGRGDREVVAFTATQIPHIDHRRYPASLAGTGYPQGIPIHAEEELEQLIRDRNVDEVIFAYSDVSLAYLDDRRRRVTAAGARFSTFDVDATLLSADVPVIAITATRTGCGKSQTARRVTELLREAGRRVVVVRHPMPYGDLAAQAVQRFSTMADLDRHQCTIEEREEYEPHLASGMVVYAGVDYGAILAEAEQEAEVIVWDGGNNDAPFFRPDLWITVTDSLRPGHALEYFPGRVNFERADLILINKIDSAAPDAIRLIEDQARALNPSAIVQKARSPVSVADPDAIRGRRVLVVEDGPTTTHGGMGWGAGALAARTHGAATLVDPRPWAAGEIADIYRRYPGLGPVLPAMGYGDRQVADLEATIAAADCDLVLVATPIDLGALIDIKQPWQRVSYHLEEIGEGLQTAVRRLAEQAGD